MKKQNESPKLNDNNWVFWSVFLTGISYLKNLDARLEKPSEADQIVLKTDETEVKFKERLRVTQRSVSMAHQTFTEHCTTAHKTFAF